MMVTVENLTTRPVLLALTSGATLRLSPGEMSAKLEDVDVQNNAKVNKLREQRVIAVHMLESEQASPAKSEAAKSGQATASSKKK
jgi:hypothetical protein